jgi:hypothetical protein
LITRPGGGLERAVDTPAGRLAELEQQVEHGVRQASQAFVQVGLALAEIRRDRLYLAVASSFPRYLDRFGLSQPQASLLEQAARCHRAITTAGGRPRATVTALQPLGPVLSREGEAGVAAAWERVSAELDGAAVTGPAVRRALASQGVVTTAPRKPGRVQVEPIETSVTRALARARGLQAEHEGRVAPPVVRERCASVAGLGRELAGVLEAVADVHVAAARLAAVEAQVPPVAPTVELPAGVRPGLGEADDGFADACVLHGSRRDPSGRCAWCRQADRAA